MTDAIEAARHAGKEALLYRTFFTVALEAFKARLDVLPESNGRLRQMLRTPAPWE